jgi:hypothetical protein
VLLEHGAPIDVRDNDKKTPLDLAFQKGKGSTTRLLLNLILSRGQTFSQKRYSLSLSLLLMSAGGSTHHKPFSLGGQMGLDVSEGSQERASGPDAAGGMRPLILFNCTTVGSPSSHRRITSPDEVLKIAERQHPNIDRVDALAYRGEEWPGA